MSTSDEATHDLALIWETNSKLALASSGFLHHFYDKQTGRCLSTTLDSRSNAPQKTPIEEI
jgi:hypothetical protein